MFWGWDSWPGAWIYRRLETLREVEEVDLGMFPSSEGKKKARGFSEFLYQSAGRLIQWG
jgi:hypothetical protein